MTRTRHIAWDLDGTLVDMDAPHRVALNAALAEAVSPDAIISMDEHLATYKGLPTRRKLDLLVAAGRVREDQRAEVARLKQARTLEMIQECLRPDPEKIAVLRALRAEGWRQCVCSNAVRASVQAMLMQAGLIGLTDFHLSNQDAPPKPDPGIYLKAAALYRIDPRDLVVVEDAMPGQTAALAAGCRLVVINGPTDVTPELILPRIRCAASVKMIVDACFAAVGV